MVRLLEYAADNFWNMLGHTRWLASDRKVMQDIWWHEDHPDSFKRKAIHKASLHELVITTSLPLQCDAQWFNKGIVSTRSFASGKLHSWTDIKSNQVKSIQTRKVLTVWRSYQKADRIATANYFCHVVAILWTILGRHNDWNWLDSIGGSWPLKAHGIFGYTQFATWIRLSSNQFSFCRIDSTLTSHFAETLGKMRSESLEEVGSSQDMVGSERSHGYHWVCGTKSPSDNIRHPFWWDRSETIQKPTCSSLRCKCCN
jgi:hypothetical protein